MFGGDDTNPLFPAPVDSARLHPNANVVPQMQLDVLVGCGAGVMNMSRVKHSSVTNPPMQFGRAMPVFRQQKLPVTLHDNLHIDEAGQSRSMLNHIPVSTGLKLSYGEEDHKSSITSAGDCKIANLSSMLPQSDNLQTELVHLNNEFDQYIRLQEETMRKGITELRNRHTVSILNALEKEVCRKFHEKDIEIESMNRKNKELSEKVRQMEAEAQSWHYKAKQNESLINLLRSNINEVLLRGAASCLKEGCGESGADDAISSCNQSFIDSFTNLEKQPSVKGMLLCRGCKGKEVSVLFLPCRHLCLCIDCDVFIDICPVCRVKKAGSFQVYLA